MHTVTQEHITFLLTGERTGGQLDAIEGLRPALFARYRDLTALRYDFPVVLVANPGDGPLIRSLSGIVDDALAVAAAGPASERIRKHALAVERAIRALVSRGAQGTFAELWEQATRATGDADPSFAASARSVRAAITVDGDVADCDAALPLRMVRHAWSAVQQQKAERLQRTASRLVQKLRDILRADFEQVGEGRNAPYLKSSVGTGFAEAFDFHAMAGMLATVRKRAASSDARTTRIHELIADLEAVPAPPPVCGSCAEALQAFRGRLPRLVAFAKAMAIAELEIEGQYRESLHDAFFDRFGVNGLDPEELAPFADVLVSVNAGRLDATEQALLFEILSSDPPIKVLVQFDDILDDHRSRIAQMALGLSTAYVLQCPSSHLLQLRDHVVKGITFEGPALVSVFSGVSGMASGQTAYLTAASAMESRVFPAFAFDPSAGHTWAERLSLTANPQLDSDWPRHHFEYEDEGHQRVSEELSFTAADFMASDARYAKHLAGVRWGESSEDALLMVDAGNRLHRVIIDERGRRETTRCLTRWRSLQELGRAHQAAPAVATASVITPTAPAPAVAEPAPSAPEVPARSPDEAYIETARCSTCNECTTINNRMFRYNADRQAYIADITAGTYAQLVEAAESCQVSVIHPGKPRDPNEPGLEDLMKRAEAFL